MTSTANAILLEEHVEQDTTNPYTASVNNLSTGLISMYSSPLVNIEKQLKELTAKQDFIITQMHNENLRLSEVQHSPEIQEAFVKLKVYHGKLLNLRKDMKLIFERSTKLKKRALHLQQTREKEERIQTELNLKRSVSQQASGSPVKNPNS